MAAPSEPNSPAGAPSRRAAPRARWATGASLLALWAAWVSWRPYTENDPFWHLMLGRAVLRAGSRVVPEPTALAELSRPRPVPEWLWDVGALLVHRLGGWPALCVLGLVLGVACAAALSWSLWRLRRADGDLPWLLTSALVLVDVLPRVHERPESLALCLLPLFVLGCRTVGPAVGWRARGGLIALAALWMQVHPTAVLAPAIFAACWLPRWPSSAPRARRDDVSTALGLVAAMFTGAHRLGVVGYVTGHVGGDATRHITDMRPVSFGYFDPTVFVQHPVYAALWLVAGAGLLLAGAPPRAELLLALLGLGVMASALRGIAVGALLLAPLAAWAMEILAARVTAWRRWVGALAVAAVALVLARATALVESELGPLGTVGLRAGQFPTGAASLLRQAPRGSRVLTGYAEGGPLGWWLDGRVRTFVDSRTPVHFDEAEYAVGREFGADPAAARRAVDRYRFELAVVARNTSVCERLRDDPAWQVVLVEALQTTFARADRSYALPTIARLVPCGPRFVGPDSCAADRGEALGAEIAAAARHLEPSFAGFLRAERALRCGSPDVPLTTLLGWVPSPGQSLTYRAARDGLMAQVLVGVGRPGEAADLLEAAIRAGEVGAFQIVAGPLAGSDPARVRSLLEALLVTLDDTAPPTLRAQLAAHCAADGDAECARFQGLRAAARGAPGAARTLCWLMAHHPAPRVRSDARAWLATLQREAVSRQRPAPACGDP